MGATRASGQVVLERETRSHGEPDDIAPGVHLLLTIGAAAAPARSSAQVSPLKGSFGNQLRGL
jgi:hypothetical protein